MILLGRFTIPFLLVEAYSLHETSSRDPRPHSCLFKVVRSAVQDGCVQWVHQEAECPINNRSNNVRCELEIGVAIGAVCWIVVTACHLLKALAHKHPRVLSDVLVCFDK